MSDDPQQKSAPRDNQPPQQEVGPVVQHVPAQESFGPAFPTASPNDAVAPGAYGIPMPPAYSALPGQAPSMPYQMQPVYGNAPAYSAAAPYGYAVPPQGAYGPPPNGFPMPPVAPLPLGTAIRQLPRQYWRVLTKPKASTFMAEQGKAAWNIIWMQLLFLSIVEAVFVLLFVLLEFFLIQMILPNNAGSMFSQAFPITAAILVPVVLVSVLISFFVGAGILHLLARAFGGEGSFLSYAYSYALISVPISALSIVLSIIPCIGSFASLAGAVYTVILLIFMTMGVHRLKGGKASAVVLIPVGTMIVLIVGAYVAYFVFIFSMISTLPHH